jgi:hypothetical protein
MSKSGRLGHENDLSVVMVANQYLALRIDGTNPASVLRRVYLIKDLGVEVRKVGM